MYVVHTPYMFYTVCEPVAVYHKDKDCIEDGKVFDIAFAAYSMLY